MDTDTDRSPVDDAGLSGLTVYSSDFVPLGRIVEVLEPATPDAPTLADTLTGRRIAIDPTEQVRSTLDGEDLVVSESMLFDVSPERDRVILNVPARRVLDTARQSA